MKNITLKREERFSMEAVGTSKAFFFGFLVLMDNKRKGGFGFCSIFGSVRPASPKTTNRTPPS